ncbi:MAG: hypothetical protein ACPKPY_01040 [Nitrososphaeraceae archaeon]
MISHFNDPRRVRVTKFNSREKQLLKYLVANCEIYYLSESESLKYIKEHFIRPISRRTYYTYKKALYKEHGDSFPDFKLFNSLSSSYTKSKSNKVWNSISMIAEREKIAKEGIQQHNIEPYEFTMLDDGQKFLNSLLVNDDKFIEKVEKLIGQTESRKKESKSIPDNATIRKEYVKCNNEFCLSCPHGPYYYAYWRLDGKKLKKKYLGRYCQ